MGVKSGLDANVMIDVINAGSGMNTASRDKFPRSILPRTFDFGFATGLMVKDVRLCLEEAKALGLSMEVAEAVAFTGRPRRTIVFAAFGAEELGLVGSRLWVQGRFSQSARPALMINADMVGHVAGGGLRVRGVDPNGALGQAVLAIAARNGVSNVSLETASWGGSDHVPFAAIGTPIAQFTTGLHGDYHTPGDVPSTLDFAGLTATARIAYELAWNISRGASALGLPAPKPPTLFDWVHDHDRMPFTEPTGGQ